MNGFSGPSRTPLAAPARRSARQPHPGQDLLCRYCMSTSVQQRPAEAVARLGFIRDTQAAGLTLGEVSSILALRGAW
jgi:hypothetical protein